MKRIFTMLILLSLFGLSSAFTQIPTNGLLAWYPFDSTAVDASGNNNNGVINGPVPTTDRFDRPDHALLFSGNGQYVSVANDVWSDSLTLSAWFYANDFGTTNPQTAGKLIFFKAPNTGYNNDYALCVGYQNNQVKVSFTFGQSSSEYVGLISSGTLQTNQWYLITATRANGVAKIYINGVLDTTTTYSFTPTDQNFNLTLGMSNATVQSFSGKLDELRIYNRALTQSEITNLYNEQLANCLIAWYPCDSNALDSSGNNYNGTIYGATNTTDRFNNPNKALMFNGNGEYINVPYDVWGNDLTLSAWFYANDFGTTNPQTAGKLIFFKAPNTGYNCDYNLCVGYQNNQIKASFDFGQGSSEYVGLLSNSTFQTNQWYLLTATRTNGVANLYINGILDATTTYSFTPVDQNFSLTLGMSNVAMQSFNGKLDDLRIYNCALSIGEIDSLYSLQSYSINEYALKDNFVKVYPNPAKDNLTIETNFNADQRLDIINIVGQSIYTTYIYKKATINTSAFPSGVYILKLYTDKETVVRKFVKE